MLYTQSCNKCLRLSYNLTSVLYRTRTTVTQNDQSIADFYAGKSVFVTGGTGFLGKMYIEKLLRGCEDIDKVFILIRQKKGESIETRVRQMLKNPIFNRLRNLRPQNFNKIVPIIGDIAEPKLGISSTDEDILKNEVSVVIHSAATVRYREPLHVAMNINFEGTRRVLDLCSGMRNLESFIYVSTAFTQLQEKELHEKVYPSPAQIDDIYNFSKKYPNDYARTVKYIRPHPNTYTFSKCVTENYIGENPDVPTTIVRPSIVMATYKEPVRGWLDNWYGSAGVCFDVARGLNHYIWGNTSNVIDAIPVDYTVNLTLIAGAKQGSWTDKKNAAVYNSTSSGCNPVTWHAVHKTFIKENLKFGFYEKQPYVVFYDSEFMTKLMTFLGLKLPAQAADLMLRLQGKEPKNVKLVNRVVTSRWSMEYFQKNSVVLHNDRARALYHSLSESDKAKFPCDPSDIDWEDYLKIYFKGITEYLLPSLLAKEKSNFVPKAEWLKKSSIQ